MVPDLSANGGGQFFFLGQHTELCSSLPEVIVSLPTIITSSRIGSVFRIQCIASIDKSKQTRAHVE